MGTYEIAIKILNLIDLNKDFRNEQFIFYAVSRIVPFFGNLMLDMVKIFKYDDGDDFDYKFIE